jgi:hypothetical protein
MGNGICELDSIGLFFPEISDTHNGKHASKGSPRRWVGRYKWNNSNENDASIHIGNFKPPLVALVVLE